MNARNVLLMMAAILLGACVRVGHIQQTAPVRSTTFSGDHKVVAQCVQRRLGGRIQEEGFGEKYVVYDSAKGSYGDLTHWAMTVARTAAGQGIVEWRVTAPQTAGGMGSAPGGARATSSGITESSAIQFWNPVLECVAQAKGS